MAYIYYEVDTFLWQMVSFVLIVVLIPGITYFIQTSLRQASSKIIDDKEPIKIKVRKLVKIYDRDSRFAREWKSGLKIRKRAGLAKTYRSKRDFADLIWQIPIFLFLVYFTFFYVESNVWMWIMAHSVYFFSFLIWGPFSQVLKNKHEDTGKAKFLKINNIVLKLLYWAVPLVFVLVFYKKWDNLGMVIFVGIVWLILLVIYATSHLTSILKT